ncbi:MAG: hypothetical protein IJE04_00925 [Bacilli bacterium]|nr:hypothetical protein [Bacilli bacterium]
MKDLLKIGFMIGLVIVVYIFKDNITTFISDNLIYGGGNKVLTYNEYYLDYDYKYVQNIDKSNIENYQEMLNIFYTFLNSGDNSYSYYCDYDNCIDDVKKLIDDKDAISNINNFVHPFNSFNSINIDISNSGKITIKTKKAYTDEEIIFVKAYIDTFIINNKIDNMSNYDKIKSFHDHIINITKYDSDHANESYTAYDLLTTGKSICGGYSDIMSIYLNRIGLQNYKINSENHIWNLVNLDGSWYHLDATWDDPVDENNQYLLHNFFLISTNELHKLDVIEHTFNSNVYIEAK